MTLAEHEARLKAEGKWDHVVAIRRAQQEKHAQRVAQNLQAQTPLLQDLAVAGYHINSVSEFMKWPASYTTALPILIAHLQRGYPPIIREFIARALAVPESRTWWDRLVEFYKAETHERVKDALALALSAAADETCVDHVERLMADPRLGMSRVFFVRVFERMGTAKARDTLNERVNDAVLGPEARASLRRLSRRRRMRL